MNALSPTDLDQHVGAAVSRSVTATLFYNYAAGRKTERAFTLSELRDEILAKTAAKKADLPWIKLALFGDAKTDKGSLRHDGNVLAITGIEADYDGERIPPHDAVERLEKAGVLALVYTSPSHTEDSPRWRVLCPTSVELPPDRRQHLVGRLNGLFGGAFSGETWTLSQSYYFGSVNSNPSHMAELVDGMPIDLCDELDEVWTGKPGTKPTAPGVTRNGRADVSVLLTEIVTADNYHEATVRLAGVWARAGVAYLDARVRLLEAYDAVEEGARDARWQTRRADVDRCLEDIYGKQAKVRDAAQAPEQQMPAATQARGGGDDSGTEYLKLLTVAAILALPRRSYLLKGLIAPTEMSIFWGAPKCGKSFLVMHIAYALSQGRAVFGRRVKQCRVLYLACEGQAGLRNRVQVLVNRYGTSDSFTAIAQPLQLLGAADTDALIATINKSFDLVVVDTLNRVIAGGDENSSADMGALIRNLDTIRDKTKAHVLVIHHGAKNGGNGPRGHGSLIGAADAIVEVARAEDGSRVATITDAKDDASGASMGFSLKVMDLDKDEDGDPVTTCLVVEHEEGELKPSIPRLTPAEDGWMSDLREMFTNGWAEEKEPIGGQGRYLTLTREQVREGLRVRGRFTLGPDGNLTGADREKMSSRLNSLKNKGRIGLSADLVWLL